MILFVLIFFLLASYSKKVLSLTNYILDENFGSDSIQDELKETKSELEEINNNTLKSIALMLFPVYSFILRKFKLVLFSATFYICLVIVLDVGVHGDRYSLFQYILRSNFTWKWNFETSAKIMADQYCDSGYIKNVIPLKWQHYYMKLNVPEPDLDEYYTLIGKCK